MKRYNAGETINKGDYLNLSTLELFNAQNGKTTLPGDKANTYIKVPSAFKVVLGPVAGLIFIIFLPFIGFVSVIMLLGHKIGHLFQIIFPKLRQSNYGRIDIR